MRNQKGFVTSEFLIAIAIAFGLTMLTFAATFTLSIVEVVQYAVFSSSRAHAAGNYDLDAQQFEARRKYDDLLTKSKFSNLFRNGWFEVSPSRQLDIRSGGGKNFEQDYAPGDNKNNLQGIRTTLTVHLLEMRLPFLGKITPEDEFSAKINALMIREVSQDECYKYMEARKDELWTFGSNRFSKFRNPSKQAATPWEDNGC